MIRMTAFNEIHDCQAVFRSLMNALANPGQIRDISAEAARLELEPSEQPALLALALTVCDRETTHMVVGDPELERRLAARTLSRPVETGAGFLFVTQADGSRADERDRSAEDAARDAVLARATPGTLTDPHRSTTMFVLVDELPGTDNSHNWCLRPGEIDSHNWCLRPGEENYHNERLRPSEENYHNKRLRPGGTPAEARHLCLSGPGVPGKQPSSLGAEAHAWIAARDRQNYEYPTGVDLIFVTQDGRLAAVPRRVRLEG